MGLHQVLVLIFGLTALLARQSSATGIHHILQACADETGTSLEDARSFIKTGEATQKLKCTFGCVLRTTNVVNDDGTLKMDLILTIAPPNKVDVVRKCSGLPPGDICENAFSHFKCYLDNDMEYFRTMFDRIITDF